MANKNEIDLEYDIQNKGLNAPRLTPAHIDSVIKDIKYHVVPGTTTTICSLVLMNGFVVNGESAAASPENFDESIGRKVAFDNARDKIWALEGYLLKQRLYEKPHVDTIKAKEILDKEGVTPDNVSRLCGLLGIDPLKESNNG